MSKVERDQDRKGQVQPALPLPRPPPLRVRAAIRRAQSAEGHAGVGRQLPGC